MKLLDKLDRRYVKLCAYLISSILIAFVLGLLIWTLKDSVGAIVRLFGVVLTPLLLGAMQSYLIHPLVVRIAKLLSRKDSASGENPNHWTLATILSIALIVVVVLALVVLVGMLITKSVTSISFVDLKAFWDYLQSEFSELFGWIKQYLGQSNVAEGDVAGMVQRFVMGLSATVSNLFFGFIFATYFLFDSKRLIEYVKRVMKAISGREFDKAHSSFLRDADRVFSAYIRGQFVDVLIVGTLYALALSIGFVPFGPTIGILGGLGNLIPGMGWIVAAVLLALVCLAQNNMTSLIIGLVIVVVINAIDANFISPRLMSSKLNVHPLLVLAALLVGGAAAGIPGMLIAIPTAALVKLRFDRWVDKRSDTQEQKQLR